MYVFFRHLSGIQLNVYVCLHVNTVRKMDTHVCGWHTQTSAFEEYGMSWHISGAKQCGVPMNVEALSSVAVIRFAMPKSPTHNCRLTLPG